MANNFKDILSDDVFNGNDIFSVVRRLNEFKIPTIKSSDGVAKHHLNNKSAYVIFKDSDSVIDLLAVLSNDKDNFSIMISNRDFDENIYGVFFDNKDSQMTDYFEKIVYDFLNDNVKPKKKDVRILSNIDKTLKSSGDSKFRYTVVLNDLYPKYMDKTGKGNNINVYSNSRDMKKFAEVFSDETKLKMIEDDNDYIFFNNFIELAIDRSSVLISLDDKNVGKIPDVIKFSNDISKFIPDIKELEEDKVLDIDD